MHSNRRGASLLEVLAALLVMSVGILGVMSLFPIAITRAVEANRLTHSTILAKRADAFVDMFGLTTDTHIPQPQENHVTHAVIDPLGWHDLAGSGFAQQYGNDGTQPVQYYLTTVQKPLGVPRFVRRGLEFLVDPANVVPADPDAVGLPLRRLGFAVDPDFSFPDRAYPTLFDPLFADPTILGPTAAVAERDKVLAAVGLPDTFDLAFSADPEPSLTSTTAVGFKTPHDLSHLETSRLVPGTRVTLFEITGRQSQVLTFPNDGVKVTQNGGDWIIEWTAPLPAAFDPTATPPGGISEVRVEFPESRFTWMLTVRKRGRSGGSITEIDCVVFHKRPSGDPSQELVYAAVQPGEVKASPSDLVDITFTGKPPVGKGDWVFDPQNCYWYRIRDIVTETEIALRFQLDRPSDSEITNLIIPEGVINVFPLRSRVDQKRLR